jgi:hypothetical protein
MTLEYKGASITFPAREGAGRAVVNGATVLLQKVELLQARSIITASPNRVQSGRVAESVARRSSIWTGLSAELSPGAK